MGRPASIALTVCRALEAAAQATGLRCADRCWWICATTAAPSPIAPPTRLTEPERTSPTANTPGTLDSSAAGGVARKRAARGRAGEHEAVRVDRDAAAFEPVGLGLGADEQEDVARRAARARRRCAGCARSRRRGRASASPCRRGELGVRVQLDVGRGLDAVDQVARHASPRARARAPACGPWPRAATGTPPPGRPSCRRRPAPPPAARTACASSARGPVPDAAAFELGQARHVGPAVARAAGDHHGARAQPAAVGQVDRQLAVALGARCSRATRTCAGISISAPNFCACTKARPASAPPEMPVGKPR